MHVSFYGRLAELYGARQLTDAPEGIENGIALRDWLSSNHPHMVDLLAHPGTRLVLDNAITDWQASLSGVTDIAIIPVVSGG